MDIVSRMGRKTLSTHEAARMGRKGAAKRKKALSPERRKEIARRAAETRWGKRV
jgi:hypothetical protein